MDMKNLLRPYRRKLLLEAAFRSLLWGLIFSGGAVFALSFFYHLLCRRTPFQLTLLVGIFAFAVGGALSFFHSYPTKKKVAARMDRDLELRERVGTMLEFWDEKTPIHQIQREDAKTRLEKKEPRQIKFFISRKEWLWTAVSCALALGMILLPHDAFSLSRKKDLGEENRAKMEALIEELREKLEEADLEEELEEDLEEILDELEEELEDSESRLEQAAKMEKAKKEMEERMDQELTADSIGKALQEYELTRPLGEGISEKAEEKVTAAMGELEAACKEDKLLPKVLADTVRAALADSGVDPDNSLYQALEKFAVELDELDSSSSKYIAQLKDIFDTATQEILEALAEQKKVEEAKKAMAESMEKAKKEAMGQGQKEKPEEGEETQETATAEEGGAQEEETSTSEEGEKPTSEEEPREPKPSGSGEPNSDGSSSASGGNSTPNEMTEEFFDPVSGSVAYGKVFALYYAEYLEALEKGEVDEEMQSVIDRYFSALS